MLTSSRDKTWSLCPVATGMVTTLATSRCGEYPYPTGRGVYFDVRSDCPGFLRLTALSLRITNSNSRGSHILNTKVWACAGSSAKQETDQGAWREVFSRTHHVQNSGYTEVRQLTLSRPVDVGPRETVGLYVHGGDQVSLEFSSKGRLGEVDASSGAITVLKGAQTLEGKPFAGIHDNGVGYAPAGSVQYELVTRPIPLPDPLPPRALSRSLLQVLESGQSGDVILKSAGTEGAAAAATPLRAHKFLLSARSPFFAAMFTQGMSEAGAREVTIEEIEPQVLLALVRFLYAEELDETGLAQAEGLLVAADRFQIPRLAALCERELCRVLAVETAAKWLVLVCAPLCSGSCG